MSSNAKPNKNELLNSLDHSDLDWVGKNTAILVVHGIGNQLPLETLDQFGRGLIKQYRAEFEEELTISHQIVTKPDSTDGVWFDNVLRINKAGSEHYIDLYEYYWANYSQDVANWKDLNRWLQGVVKGANNFYEKNALIGKHYKDKSPFFDSKTGAFKKRQYRLFLTVISKILLVISLLWRLLIWLVSLIPFLGGVADAMLQSYADGAVHDIVNIISEVAIYNVFDPKSKFYHTKRQILDGCVKALTYLIERPADTDFDLKALTDKVKEEKLKKSANEREILDNKLAELLSHQELYYPSVIVAAHSLGTQVSYDAINKLNLLINTSEIGNYDENGMCKFRNKEYVANQLCGFVTFGCPLDKTVFFLRENVPDNEYVRQQFLDNYHGFKQRNLDFSNNQRTNKYYLKASCDLKHLLENVKWRNYYDHKDYVSGGLDYYTRLINIDCEFKAKALGFTHSNYWDCDKFYRDIICNFLQEYQIN